MKHQMKKLFSMLLVVLMLVGMLPMGIIGASAAEATGTATFSFTGGDSKNHDSIPFSDEVSGVSVEFTAGTHNTKPRWDSGCVRFYGTDSLTNDLTVSAPEGTTITQIAFTMDGSYTMNACTASVGTLSSTTWTGSASSVVFTTTAQTRFAGATVTYSVPDTESGGEGGDTNPTTPDIPVEGECQHVWDEWTEITPATCEKAGEKMRECTLCEELEEGTIDPLGHAWSETWETITEATCTTDGSQARECTREGCTATEEGTIPATGHSYVDGVCSVCGEKEPAVPVYTLVTDAGTLAVGDKVIIAAKDSAFALSTTQNGNNRDQAAITKDDDKLGTLSSDVQILTLEAGTKEGTFAFNTGSGYLYAASSSKNYLRTEKALSDNSSWTITIASGAATITAQGSNTHNLMQFNKSSGIFSAYDKAQQAIVLYKLNTAATECLHEETNSIAAVAPTCTTPGNTAGKWCVECEQYLDGYKVLPATGHSGGDDGICTGCNTHIVELAYALASGETLPGGSFTLTGKITEIVTEYSEQYQNITVMIAVEDYEEKPIECYHLKAGTDYTGVDTSGLQVGDIITVTGELKNYNGTIEFNSGCVFTDLQSTHTHVYTAATTPATCTVDGKTVYTCGECGHSYTETIPATGHSYVDGVCSVCNAVKPVYQLTDLANIGPKDKVIITMTMADGKVYALENKTVSSKPAAVEVTVEGDTLSEGADGLEWNIVNDNGNLTIYVDESEANALYWKSGTDLAVGEGENNSFIVQEGYLYYEGNSRRIGVYSNKDWRAYQSGNYSNIADQTLGFYVYTVPCAHENKEERAEIPATCTEAGRTAGTYCLDCEKYISGGEVIEALGHSYGDDGSCTNCDKVYPIADGKKYYIAAQDGNYFYMTSGKDGDNTRLLAEDSALTELPEAIAAAQRNKVFTAVRNEDGTWSIMANGILDAKKYLGWGSSNSVKLVAQDDEDIIKFNATEIADGVLNLSFAVTEEETRYLSMNGNDDHNWFACYTGSQEKDLVLIPVADCGENHTEEVIPAVAATCNKTGLTEGSVCSACGELLAAQEVTPANGHTLGEDNVCSVCGNAPAISSSALVLDSTLQLKISVTLNTFAASDCRIHVTIGDDTEYQELDINKMALIPAHRLYENVKIELLYKDAVVNTATWTLEGYTGALRENPEYNTNESMMALLDALENYGTFAAYYADSTGEAPDTTAIAAIHAATLKSYKQVITGTYPADLNPVASLYLDDACNIRVKFDAAAWTEGGYTLYVNDEKVSPVDNGAGKVVWEIRNLKPQEWDDTYTIAVKDTADNVVFSVQYSVLSYAYLALNRQTSPAALNNLLKAMYLYNQAAAAYTNA